MTEHDLLRDLYEASNVDRYAGAGVKVLSQKYGAEFDRLIRRLQAQGYINDRSPVGSLCLSDSGWMRADDLFGG